MGAELDPANGAKLLTAAAAIERTYDARLSLANAQVVTMQLDFARMFAQPLDTAMSVVAVARQEATLGDKINVAAILLPGVGKAIGIGAKAAGIGGKVASEALTGTALARTLGAEGEALVGITGPKVGIRVPGTGQMRFPMRSI